MTTTVTRPSWRQLERCEQVPCVWGEEPMERWIREGRDGESCQGDALLPVHANRCGPPRAEAGVESPLEGKGQGLTLLAGSSVGVPVSTWLGHLPGPEGWGRRGGALSRLVEPPSGDGA